MERTGDRWPLVWTTVLRAGASPVSVFDLSELRAVVDVLRVAAGLDPVAWEGRTADDPTFEAWVTPVRAVHFTQLRAAINELYGTAAIDPPGEFTGGPIVAGSRVIRLADLEDLRGWVEQYERVRPERAARLVRVAVPALTKAAETTEVWCDAGCVRTEHDRDGRISSETWVLDQRAYRLSYGYEGGRLVAVGYPDGERVSLGRDGGATRSGGGALTLEPEAEAPSSEDLVAAHLAEHGPLPVRRDGLDRPVCVGDSARPSLRLAYGPDGAVAKMVRAGETVHLVGDLYERHVGLTGERIVRYLPRPDGGRWRISGPRWAASELTKAPSEQRKTLAELPGVAMPAWPPLRAGPAASPTRMDGGSS